MRVKICGITCLEDALMAAALGADALGFVFYPASPRNISLTDAKAIMQALPPFISSVALLVNPSVDEVNKVIDLKPHVLQFHGNESAEFCQSFNYPYIKAVAMRDGIDLSNFFAEHKKASGFLLDAYHADKAGGTGECFDWQRFPKQADKPLILAGGLNAENVGQAIGLCRPYAVDVSSGVEKAPGIKSRKKVDDFINQAKRCI